MLETTQTMTLALTGCGSGIGVGLDENNCVDMIKEGMPAEKAFVMGDKVTYWNGTPMSETINGEFKQKKLKDVVEPAEAHTVVVERTLKSWENAGWEKSSWVSVDEVTGWDSPSWG